MEASSHAASTWQQGLAAHALRLAAASQAVYMVVLHFVWIFMLIMAMEVGMAGDAAATAGGKLLDVFRWLGGMDAGGHGGIGEVTKVWGMLSILVYLARVALHHLRGGRPRPAWSVLRTSLLSGAIALAGFGIAMTLLEPASSGSLWFVLSMAFATFLATAWATAVARCAEWAGQWMETRSASVIFDPVSSGERTGREQSFADPEPVPPTAPQPGDCCGEGCAHCVLDRYDAALACYETEHAAWQARRSAARSDRGDSSQTHQHGSSVSRVDGSKRGH